MKKFEAKKGQIVFQAGQSCPGFVLLQEGTIKVTLTGLSGRELVLYRVRPGEVCLQTLSCLINDQPYGAEGVAQSDLKGHLVPAGEFREKFAADEQFRDMIMHSVSSRFSEYQQLIEDVALTGFDSRLAKVLLRECNKDGTVEMTHAELAVETASGRAYVTRRLAEFAKRGWVRQNDDGVVILQNRKLEQTAAGLR